MAAKGEEVDIARIQEVRLGCRGPTWGHASRRNVSEKAADEARVSAKHVVELMTMRLKSESAATAMELRLKTHDKVHLAGESW